MTIDPYANCNVTIPNDLCTLETCCLAQSSFLYRPNYGWNLAFAILFGVFIPLQLGLGVWYKSWGFMVGMVIGLILEVLGYISRVMLHDNPFDDNAFLLYLITLTIAPVFLTAAIYLTLSRIFIVYAPSLSRLAPRTVALTFMTSDFLSLVLQAAGGAIADTAPASDPDLKQTGIDVMIAGLVLQCVSLLIFLIVGLDFFARVHRHGADASSPPSRTALRSKPTFRLFLASLLVATLAILARSIFRAMELWGGFAGELWNNETEFLILDGAMITLAVLLLTVLHPGPAFGAEWHSANWSLRTKKGKKNAREEGGEDDETVVGGGSEAGDAIEMKQRAMVENDD